MPTLTRDTNLRRLEVSHPLERRVIRILYGLCRLDYVCSLRAFLAFGDLELNLIAFLQTLVSLGSNRAVVNKDVRPIRTTDKAVYLRIIEPLNGSFQSFHEPLFLHIRLRGQPDVPAVLRCILEGRVLWCQENAMREDVVKISHNEKVARST